MNCKNCGKEIADDAVFCKHCGKRTDGLKTCYKCGKDIEEDSAFCSYCGASMNAPKVNKAVTSEVAVTAAATAGGAKTSSVDLHKVMNWVLLGLASAVALFAIIFIFFTGIQQISIEKGELSGKTSESIFSNIFFYFSKAYKERNNTLKLLEARDIEPSSYFKAATLLPCIFGTIISAGSFVAVIALSITYLVYTIQYAMGKRTKRADGLAIAAAAVYVFCAVALYALIGVSNSSVEVVQSSSGKYTTSSSTFISLNPATIAGVVLCAVFAGLWLCAKVVDLGKKALKRDYILKACLSFAGLAVAVVVVSLLTLPAISATSKEIEVGYSNIYTSTQTSKYSILNLVQMFSALFADDVPEEYFSDAWAMFAMGLLSYLTAIGALVSGGAYIVKSMNNIGSENNKRNQLAAAIWTVILAVLTMAFVIVEGSLANGIIKQAGGSLKDGFNYGVPIAAFVLSIVPLVLTIVQNVLCKNKVAVSAPINANVVNNVNSTDNTQA